MTGSSSAITAPVLTVGFPACVAGVGVPFAGSRPSGPAPGESARRAAAHDIQVISPPLQP
ncbi:hypothetical protein [Streptomyces sp. SAI-229]|uniref:hypothetical protein n=1 Tax=Streptomyces sp. SAI-229 TaxID=3377731 RepID=UPI003C7E4E0A